MHGDNEASRLAAVDRTADPAAWLSAIGHDLRAALAGIHGYAGLLAMEATGPLTEAQRRYVDGIAAQVADLGWRLEIALGLMKLGVGQPSVPPSPCDLQACAERTLAGMRGAARGRRVDLACAAAAGPAVAALHEDRLLVALSLVLGQALRGCPVDGTVELLLADDRPGTLTLRVVADGSAPEDGAALVIAGGLAAQAGGEAHVRPAADGRRWQWVLQAPRFEPMPAR